MVCLTIFTESQEWDVFVSLADAVAAATAWQASVLPLVDITGKDSDGKATRGIFAIDSIIGMTISDASRWKKPHPPAESQ